MKNIAVLGSTGSIGRQTCNVVDWFPDKFRIVGLAAHSNVDLLAEQIKKYNPEIVAVYNDQSYHKLKEKVPFFQGEIIIGLEGLKAVVTADAVDTVVSAVSGVIGLVPTVEAIKAKKDIALANKETLVAAGEIVMSLVQTHNVRMIPVDSEHSAIFQCLEQEQQGIEKIILTASGGPFREYTKADLFNVTPQIALKHPTWVMGKKITIDSATMMNKGLEVIEAKWLFDVAWNNIEVVVHPQSIIHSMVQYGDGSILAHLGKTDMHIPIQYALTYPERWKNHLERLDFAKLGQITFEAPDLDRFPCLKLAYEAGKSGGTFPAAMNAANEELVALFLSEKIGFMDIPRIIEEILGKHQSKEKPALSDIVEVDQWAREQVLFKEVT